MNDREWGGVAPLLVAGFGAVLLLVAVVTHARELTALNSPTGPSIALLLDGLPALGLVYAGYWLSGTDLEPEGRSTVATWCLVGATLFVAVVGATVLVRTIEGRVISEPVFVLLIAAEAGGFAGVVAGYYSACARRDARRAGTASDALAFVNELIRHDLRNDLAVIRGQAQLAAERPSGDADSGPGDPGVIIEKTDEALARIEATRAVAETLTGDPDIDGVDLAAIAAEMVERVDDASDTDVRTDLPESAPVAANAGLRSVVDNLLENAVEHNDAEDPRVTVVVRDGTHSVRLTVRDNGPGIPDEREGHLFETGEPGSGNGGLALIRRLVDEYGGDVRIEENEPCGSVFVVELPRAAGAEQ